MQAQSLLFDRSAGWTVEKAKQWAKSHGYKSGKVDVTDRYVRLRQQDPKGFAVKRTVPFGKGIRAVVAREETMKKKTKTTRRPARKSAAKPKAAHRASPKRRTAPKRRAAPKSKTSVVTARRRPRHAREVRRTATESRRRPRRMRETPVVAEARRRPKHRKPTHRKPTHRKSTHRKRPSSYVMAKRRPHHHRKVSAWRGDSAGHSKAAKKGWRTRKGGKTTRKAAESRRRPRRHARETTTVQARRRPRRRVHEPMTVQARRRPKHRRTRETKVVQARRRPRKYTRETTTVQARRRPRRHARETKVVQARRRPKHRRARETKVVRSYRAHKVRAPSFGSMARTAGNMALEVGTAAAAFLAADAIDRFLAGYDPSAANKPANKFTSDGVGTLANALNVASAPDLWRYGSLGVLTFGPLIGSLFIKKAAIRSSVEGMGVGAGIKFAATLWSSVLMPLLIGKDTSTPALQKSWIARLYPAEVSAALNMKSGTAAVSSGGAASKAGTLSDGSEQTGVGKDAGPFALADRFGRHREWVTPSSWTPPAIPGVPGYNDPGPTEMIVDDDDQPAPPVQSAWPPRWGHWHRWGLRGVGDAVQNMAHTIAAKTGVHPAHAVNAAMHAVAEPHDLTQALQRALPHLRRELLIECARHVHPHVVRMHAHARYPREHEEWTGARAAEGLPAPEHDAPESEWREWHGKRASAGLPYAPPPPDLPASTPAHLRERHEWHPNYEREIAYDRYPTVQQVMGIGAGGPATGGNPGQPGLGEVFSNAVQAAGASIPGIPLENAVTTTAYAAAEPFNCTRAIERAMPLIRSELARYCAENMSPYIQQLHAQTGVPVTTAAVPTPPVPAPPLSVIEFVPSPPPPSWTRGEAEWHTQERQDWDRTHGKATPAVEAAATHAAKEAAAPHADAKKPAVAAAVQAAATGAATAASAAPPGTPTPVVHQIAKEGAQAAADAHGPVADHPAVQAAVVAAAPAAAAAHAAAPHAGTSGVGNPPRNLPVGPPKLPHPGPQPLQSECGCLDDSPYLGFIGDEVEQDLLWNAAE